MYSLNINKIITKCQSNYSKHGLDAFLLLELLVALLMVTVFLGVLVYWQGVIITWRSDSVERLHAITFARSTCERLITDKSLVSQNQALEDEIQLSWQQEKVIIPELSEHFPSIAQPLPSISLIIMEVTWKGCRPNWQKINIITAGAYDE